MEKGGKHVWVGRVIGSWSRSDKVSARSEKSVAADCP